MIAKIKGKLLEVRENSLLLEVGSLTYTVLAPNLLLRKLSSKQGENITLFTYHYFEAEKGSGNLIPRLIGFSEEIEEEFFEKFITVKSVGAKTALKSISIPISKIAAAIEQRDTQTLTSLPKIGKRTAEQIIAELKGKMAKFALLKEDAVLVKDLDETLSDLKEEALAILLQLDYKKNDAVQMINHVVKSKKKFSSVEELIQEIYSQVNLTPKQA